MVGAGDVDAVEVVVEQSAVAANAETKRVDVEARCGGGAPRARDSRLAPARRAARCVRPASFLSSPSFRILCTPRPWKATARHLQPIFDTLIMSPVPISPGLVHLILQYISPPSQLTQPLPPHLVSKSLAQRHHFLHLTPDFPGDYLCWPSSPERQSRAVECLETLPRTVDDEPVVYPVQYTSDEEHSYAHVDLSTGNEAGARLIFQWDHLNGWQYHDTNLMPFPPDAQSEVQDVSTSTTEAQHMSAIPLSSLQSYAQNDHNNDEAGADEDSYWNSYGSHDPDSASYARSVPSSAKDVGGSTEDAYWARYSNVHGECLSSYPLASESLLALLRVSSYLRVAYEPFGNHRTLI